MEFFSSNINLIYRSGVPETDFMLRLRLAVCDVCVCGGLYGERAATAALVLEIK